MDLLQKRYQLALNIKLMKAELDSVDAQIREAFEQDIERQYSLKDEPFGVTHVELDGFKVTFKVPKKVDWDQERLAQIYDDIKAKADKWGKVSDYIKVKYEVPERAYAAWPEPLLKIFDPARTVKQGNITIEVEPQDVA